MVWPHGPTYDERVEKPLPRSLEARRNVDVDGLSRREGEVLEMAAEGLTNAEIGAALHLTVHSIKFHLASIYRKLGVTNRTEAAVAYLRASTGDHLPTNGNRLG